MSFSQIQQKFGNFLLRSGGFSSISAKIWCYFAQIEWFCSNLMKIWLKKHVVAANLNLQQHIFNFDRPDCWPTRSDLTWLMGFCSWWRVFSLETRCHRVGRGLGINLTRTNPWTPLVLGAFFSWHFLWKHFFFFSISRKIIRYFWSIINMYSLLSHEW